MNLTSIGIIGAGQMGSGIAYVCAASGYKVKLYDIDSKLINIALEKINKNLSYQLKIKNINQTEQEAAFSLVEPINNLRKLSSVDLIIECVIENKQIKSDIYQELEKYLKKEAVVATNTSSLSISNLASTFIRPNKFIGIHFMNPPHMTNLIELIKGDLTDNNTLNIARQFVSSLDKKCVISKDSPAFIVNRILIPMINEAIYALHEGVADVNSIDQALKLGANHPMGPLELADFIGLDTCLYILQTLYTETSNEKYKPSPLLVQYVDKGLLGKKTGKGFYKH